MSEIKEGVPPRRRSWTQWLLVLSLGVVLVTLVLQSFEIRRLQSSVHLWRRRAQWPADGVRFPPLPTTTLRGDARMVGARSTKTQIIVVSTTSCPYCRASLPQWRRLSALVDTSHAIEMVWLSLSPRDSTFAYASAHGLPQEDIAVEPDSALVLAARIRGVPLTLVVDTAGVIRHLIAGVLTMAPADSVLLAARMPRVTGTSAGAAFVPTRRVSP